MNYLPVQELADKWDISKRRIQIWCKEGRIVGAKMIGNMWVIPQNAQRPSDARVKNPAIKGENTISHVRRELKKILKIMFKRCCEIGIEEENQRMYVLTVIAGGLCSGYLGMEKYEESIYRVIYRDLTSQNCFPVLDVELVKMTTDFIESYKEDSEIENILSWAYQYTNKIIENSLYGKTQFFTEKYMIKYLIENTYKMKDVKKILDPCIGGGNFLAECLEYMCREVSEEKLQENIVRFADKLFGYDIDREITNIAVVNIRLRAISILKRKNIRFNFDMWDRIRPNIYKSKEKDNVEGALAVSNWQVTNLITGECKGINDVLGNADIVLTNPPFETVKGMMQEQKDFLKKVYPESNCDTCVSFMEAIYKMLNADGICGIVTQSAWMHLKTFKTVRKRLTSQYTIYKIINLGSGAFQDLSGEKSNVSLIVAGKQFKVENKIDILNLTEYSLKDKAKKVEEKKDYIKIPQKEIDGPNGYDFSEKNSLKLIGLSGELYKDIAVPMQGTSTGNAKKLVGYFWEHFGDYEWVSVSNGGGYCRWQGLNDKVVKWGEDGEYIKAEKGSALRNVKYFPETYLAFSDTGTAGLNVRLLLDKQIFIASGPGIRIKKGNVYSHLALLNSRLSSFYVKNISPKLTLAAGYIGQIPVKESVYTSIVLEKNAGLCVELKRKMLSVRPNNLEYDASFFTDMPDNLYKAAWRLFNEDITNELLKLEIESKIDSYILKEYDFSEENKTQLAEKVGECAYHIHGADGVELSRLDNYIDKVLDASCSLKRTRTSRHVLGSDGVIEFTAKDLGINPEVIVRKIQENPDAMKKVLKRYGEMILHNTVLNYLGYSAKEGVKVSGGSILDISAFLADRFGKSMEYKEWLESTFNTVHREIFKGVPYLIYEDGKVYKKQYSDRASR